MIATICARFRSFSTGGLPGFPTKLLLPVVDDHVLELFNAPSKPGRYTSFSNP
jgi:hypothetical protein